MTDQELEQRLRAWYKGEVGGGTAPAELRSSVAAIPRTHSTIEGGLGGRRNLTLLVAAAVATALIGGAIAVGSGIVRLTSVLPPPNVSLPSQSLEPTSSEPIVSGGWTTTADSGQARYLQSATVLRDGEVLVTGGRSESTSVSHSLATAEIYEPGRGTWRAVSNMVARRSAHSATLLADGRVLVAGGYDDWAALRSAELYDPATGSWAATGNMIEARGYHTATLLPDGRVLVAGGRSNNSSTGHALTSAELYDPIAGTWTPAASLLRGLTFHTATLLPNGQVLVAGAGIKGVRVDITLTAELYDPLNDQWTATGSMKVARAYHTATLRPNGQVLVAGGYDSVAGTFGPGGGAAQASSELYDPSVGTWSATGNMSRPRALFTATLMGTGNVIVVGGDDGSGDAFGTSTYSTASGSGTADLYDEVTGSWTGTSTSGPSRVLHVAVLLPDGQVLVEGGMSAGQALSTAVLYRPQ